jgi:hypothetical protein
MTETAEQIAARYGAILALGAGVQRIPAGTSGLPNLVWHETKGLIYETKPDLQKLTFGRPPISVTSGDGRVWRSMGDLSRYLGVSLCAVSRAVKKGKVDALLARHERKAA